MDRLEVLENLMAVIEKRADSNPSDSYVAKLLHAPNDQVLKKIGEEATEVLLAVKGGDKNEVIHEVADLLFHLLVMLEKEQIKFVEILDELQDRQIKGKSDVKK